MVRASTAVYALSSGSTRQFKCDCVTRDLEGIPLRKHLMTLVYLSEDNGSHFVGVVELLRQISLDSASEP